MYRSKLKNQYNNNLVLNKVKYNRQCNFCGNLLCKEKKKFNLDLKIFHNNRKFWQNIKPFFSNKQNVLQKNISVMENDNVTSKASEVAGKLNNYFIEAIANL